MGKAYFIFLAVVCVAFCSILTLSQSGGTFVIQKSVIAGGGGQSSGNLFVLNGTTGETVSGRTGPIIRSC